MAILRQWYAMDGEGVDLNNLQTSVTITNDPSIPAPRAKIGERRQGMNGSEWMFVIAGATVTAFNFIAINGNFSAQNNTTAIQSSGIYTFGVAEFQGISTDGISLLNAQPGDNFWALMKGNGGVRINAPSTISVALGAKLYVSQDIPGFLTTSTTTSNFPQFVQIVGVFPAVSATSGSSTGQGQTNLECGMYTYPFPGVLISVQPTSV